MPDTLQKHVVAAVAVERDKETVDTTDVDSGGGELCIGEVKWGSGEV